MAKAKCKKFDLSGKELGVVEIEYGDEPKVNTQMIKDYIVALRANARQWSANTKGRSENNHSGAKPHAQKGTGKARQGFLGAPQYKGGGRVFGPKPKFDQHVRINRKERRAIIKVLLLEKLKEGNLVFLDSKMDKFLPAPKTKVVKNLFDQVAVGAKRIACLGQSDASEEFGNFKMSMRNLPRASFIPVMNVNGYDVLVNTKLFVMDTAKEELEAVLRG